MEHRNTTCRVNKSYVVDLDKETNNLLFKESMKKIDEYKEFVKTVWPKMYDMLDSASLLKVEGKYDSRKIPYQISNKELGLDGKIILRYHEGSAILDELCFEGKSEVFRFHFSKEYKPISEQKVVELFYGDDMIFFNKNGEVDMALTWHGITSNNKLCRFRYAQTFEQDGTHKESFVLSKEPPQKALSTQEVLRLRVAESMRRLLDKIKNRKAFKSKIDCQELTDRP